MSNKPDGGPDMTADRWDDPRAINPRYQGLRLSDVARVLTRPKNPKAREALDRIQGKAPVTRSKP